MQLTQSSHSDPRLTKLHAHAYHCIRHPCGNDCDCARAVVHMDDTPAATLFAISNAHLTPIKRVPAIVNLQFLPDMGRMSVESLSVDVTGCTSGTSRLAQKWRRSFPSSRVAADSGCPSATTWPRSCPDSPSAPSKASTNSPQLPTPLARQNNLPDRTRTGQPCTWLDGYERNSRKPAWCRYTRPQ